MLLAKTADLWERLQAAPTLLKAFAGGLRERLKSPNLAPGQNAKVNTEAIEGAEKFPAYYLESFHGQPNGYLSEESARIYDLGQSVFFLGTDGLVRKTLLARLPDKARNILDLGCASGGSTLPLAQKYPNAQIHAVDLSPFFLQRAQKRAERFSLTHRVFFHQANAEDLSLFPEQSFDLITSTFLHHEVPLSANRNILREVKRLLQPGGLFAALDELQESDTPKARWIPALAHEPHYNDYFRLDWLKELKEAGFPSGRIEVSLLTKVILAWA